MSRSYKHSPVWTDPCGDRRFEKKYANRRVRNRNELLQFSAYKRLYAAWRIVECSFFCTLSQYNSNCTQPCLSATEETVQEWKKEYRRK